MIERPYIYQGNIDERLADLERIGNLKDPILRNLLITQRYHDMSRDLARVLGGDNANWSTFACWASKTAGKSIRKEDVPELSRFLATDEKLDRLRDRFYENIGFFSFLISRFDPLDLPRAVLQEVSNQIAAGNLRVYAELSPLFAGFADSFAPVNGQPPEPKDVRDEKLEKFLKGVDDGPAESGTKAHLANAFRAYFEASTCADPEQKAQLILLGNVLIGFHEQTRLQPNIEGGIDAPFSDTVSDCFVKVRPRMLSFLVAGSARTATRLMAKEFKDDWQRIATRYMMKLTAPNGAEIPLGMDLPPGNFDPLLAHLKNQQLVDFLSQFDADLNTTRGSAAVNWTLLPDRMKFIGELFRVSQRDPKWFGQPFENAQREAISRGRIPPEPL